MSKTILSLEYGSRAHGTHTVDSDSDIMSIFVEDPGFVTGIDTIDTQASSTAGVSSRSGVGDTDETAYPLRKFAALAAHGNPTVLTAFFVPVYIEQTFMGRKLVVNRNLFLSKQAGARFLGYMRGQRDAMTGLKNKRTNRPELIHKFGYDTKFAYHMIRLGMQGIELMNTGRVSLPMIPFQIDELMSIRKGETSREDVLDYSWYLDEKLKSAIDWSDLPDAPDRAKINQLLHEIYMEVWK
jgi:predicted nucleotidyltransferase